VLLIVAGFAAMTVTAAFALVTRRDMGTGVLPERPGPAVAGPRLRSAFALAWRLQWRTWAAWAAGYALFGAVIGNVAGNVDGFLGSDRVRDTFARLGGGDAPTEILLSAMLGFLGIGAAAYGVQAAGRAAAEEASGRAELLLSAAVPRVRWLLGHATIAILGSAALLAVGGGFAGLAHGARTGDAGWAWRPAGSR
jgi:ABC-2 type transport system permease protein